MINTTKMKQLREGAQMTQEELAARVCVSRPVIAQIEVGIKMPGVATLKRIADVFGVTMDSLVVSPGTELSNKII